MANISSFFLKKLEIIKSCILTIFIIHLSKSLNNNWKFYLSQVGFMDNKKNVLHDHEETYIMHFLKLTLSE